MSALDQKSWALLAVLQQDGRAALKTLAEAAQLSIPATAERVKKLEEAGVIAGVRAEIEPDKAGYGVQAMIGVQVRQPAKANFLNYLRKLPQVLECHHVSGEDSYLLKVVSPDLPALESLIALISPYGETRTSIIFSTPIKRRALQAPSSLKKGLSS